METFNLVNFILNLTYFIILIWVPHYPHKPLIHNFLSTLPYIFDVLSSVANRNRQHCICSISSLYSFTLFLYFERNLISAKWTNKTRICRCEGRIHPSMSTRLMYGDFNKKKSLFIIAKIISFMSGNRKFLTSRLWGWRNFARWRTFDILVWLANGILMW